MMIGKSARLSLSRLEPRRRIRIFPEKRPIVSVKQLRCQGPLSIRPIWMCIRDRSLASPVCLDLDERSLVVCFTARTSGFQHL